jgi:peptidoglycan/LPS O-acetylase OafA/YrhL
VDVFFVLSGYLITRLLLDRGINLREFYLRRAMRLYPALLLMLALYLVLGPIAFGERAHAPRDVLISALYLSDYARVLFGFPLLIGHTWSLSVEEHFYLLWPLVLGFLLKHYTRPQAARRVVALALALFAWRAWCYWSGQGLIAIYYRFDTHAVGLAAGCALAMLGTARLPKWSATVGLAVVVAAMSAYPWQTDATNPDGMLIAEIGAVLLVGGLQRDGWMTRALSFGWLPYIGRLSYGMYLFHYPIMVYLREQYDHTTAMVVGSALSVGLAALSYHTVEAAIRQRKAVSALSSA